MRGKSEDTMLSIWLLSEELRRHDVGIWRRRFVWRIRHGRESRGRVERVVRTRVSQSFRDKRSFSLARTRQARREMMAMTLSWTLGRQLFQRMLGGMRAIAVRVILGQRMRIGDVEEFRGASLWRVGTKRHMHQRSINDLYELSRLSNNSLK